MHKVIRMRWIRCSAVVTVGWKIKGTRLFVVTHKKALCKQIQRKMHQKEKNNKVVPCVSYRDLTEQSFNTNYRNKKPVLIRGEYKIYTWYNSSSFFDHIFLHQDHVTANSICTLWSKEYLTSKILAEDGASSRMVSIFVSHDNTHFVDQPDVVTKVPQLFSDLLLRLTSR